MSDTEKKTETAQPATEPNKKGKVEEEVDDEFQAEDDQDESIDEVDDAPDDPEEMNALNEEAELPIEELRKRYAMPPADDDEGTRTTSYKHRFSFTSPTNFGSSRVV